MLKHIVGGKITSNMNYVINLQFTSGHVIMWESVRKGILGDNSNNLSEIMSPL